MPVTEDVRTDVVGTPARLSDGSWGVRIRSYEDLTDRIVTVRRRNGDERPRRLLNRVFTYRDAHVLALYVAEDVEEDGTSPGHEDDELPIPQTTTAAGRALLAGRLKATVTLPDGREIPVEVRVRRRGSGGAWVNGTPMDSGAVVSIYANSGRERIGRVVAGFRAEWFDAAADIREAVRVLFAAAGNAANQPRMEERGYRFSFEGDAAGRDVVRSPRDDTPQGDLVQTTQSSLSSPASFRIEDEADEVKAREERESDTEVLAALLVPPSNEAHGEAEESDDVREIIVEALACWAVNGSGTTERRAEQITLAENWLNVVLPL